MPLFFFLNPSSFCHQSCQFCPLYIFHIFFYIPTLTAQTQGLAIYHQYDCNSPELLWPLSSSSSIPWIEQWLERCSKCRIRPALSDCHHRHSLLEAGQAVQNCSFDTEVLDFGEEYLCYIQLQIGFASVLSPVRLGTKSFLARLLWGRSRIVRDADPSVGSSRPAVCSGDILYFFLKW